LSGVGYSEEVSERNGAIAPEEYEDCTAE